MATNLVDFGVTPPPVPLPEFINAALSAENDVATEQEAGIPVRDAAFELWPAPGTPAPDLSDCTNRTQAVRVYQFLYGTAEEKEKALGHLANIFALVARINGAFYKATPAVVFRGEGNQYHPGSSHQTAGKDWEQSSKWNNHVQKQALLGWFRNALVEHIAKYGPEYTTRRELLELVNVRDPRLCHVCDDLVFDMMNAGNKQKLHDIDTVSLLSSKGGDLVYFDARHETYQQATQSHTMVERQESDYAGAVHELVQNPDLRHELSSRQRLTLELLLRKLDAGADGGKIVDQVASMLRRDEHTVRRHIAEIRKVLGPGDSPLRRVLGSLLFPNEPSYISPIPTRPTMAMQEQDKAA